MDRNVTCCCSHLIYPSFMHPLVRDLYKRALVVGVNYPQGMDYVRTTWKKALRNSHPTTERDLRKAVAKGRFYVREMQALIQLKKYRAMDQRYGRSASTYWY
jgi:hypothetical protein